MKITYICETSYHVLISILKILQTDNLKCEIILIDNMKDIDRIYDNLVSKRLFEKVYRVPKVEIPYFKRDIFKYRKMRKFLESKYNDEILKGRNIYIYNDWSSIGYYLYLKGIRYYLLEDGLDCYKRGGMIEQYYKKLEKPVYKIRRFFKYGVFCMGDSPYMYSLEVNNKNGLCINNKKIIEMSRKELYLSLNVNKQQMLLDIFLDKDHEITGLNENQEASILLTQPLYFDHIVKSEEIQIALYKKLIKEYGIGQIWIKPHPRDEIDYSKVFSECHAVLLPQGVPVELFEFLPDFRCKRLITAYSTAANGIDFCEDKVIFTREEIDEMCKTIENEMESEIK